MEGTFLTSDGRIYRQQSLSTDDPNKPLTLCPHYSDTRFQKEQTVFGSERPGLFYNYSDRLFTDQDKHQRGLAGAKDSGATENSARWLEAYLSWWHWKRVKLHHVIAGVNRSNGFGYAAYGYEVFDHEEQCLFECFWCAGGILI